MTYSPSWTQADASGSVTDSHFVRATDVAELAEAINRRRRLTYQDEQDFSEAVAAEGWISRLLISHAGPPPYASFRTNIQTDLLNAPAGALGGQPASPESMRWLWPIDDGDLGKQIVNGFTGVGPGQVSLFDKLNGGDEWTDPALLAGATPVKAVHVNQLRRAVQWLRRGRWVLPVYASVGLYSAWPDQSWFGQQLYNSGGDELRSVSFVRLATDESPARGVSGATVLDTTALTITADTSCTVEVYRVKRSIDFDGDLPTWNEYAPSTSSAWSQPGGLGAEDAAWIATVACPADTPTTISGPDLSGSVQAMVDGEPQNLLFRRSDAGAGVVTFSAALAAEFELTTPPN